MVDVPDNLGKSLQCQPVDVDVPVEVHVVNGYEGMAWVNRVTIETVSLLFCFEPLRLNTDAPLHDDPHLQGQRDGVSVVASIHRPAVAR